jgi:iron complex outermembrane receptor protein
MLMRSWIVPYLIVMVLVPASAQLAGAQTTGTIRGIVRAGQGDYRLHNATVLLMPLGRSQRTTEAGEFEFKNLPPGSYELVVHAPALADERKSASVAAGETATVEFALTTASRREQITVTATGRQETTLEAIPSSTSLDSIQLVQNSQASLGEALDGQPGVAQRGFGPGSSRPVIRGFSGDRVLVMQDGITVGSLASQSGDHGEPIDVLALERVEIVRGPATLLYGSNGIGGVVNAISGNFDPEEQSQPGLRGYVTGVGGSASAYGASNGGIDYVFNKWNLWGAFGGQRTGDYDTPIGEIANSRTRNYGGSGGFGWTSTKVFWELGYNYDNRRYGIPFAAFLESGGTTGPEDENINIRMRTHTIKFNGGLRDRDGFLSGGRLTLNYTRYRHGEFEGDEVGTQFKNDQFNYRLVLDQKKRGSWSGSFGLSGVTRNFESLGDEALAPPTDQVGVSLFTLQNLDFERVALQFGGRFEHQGYTTDPTFLPARPDRTFNGGSAAAGARFHLWKGGAFIANYTHSFRAPALEELYNFGPHPGNLTFEIGNPNLEPESGDGIDLSLRQQAGKVHAEANFFYYKLRKFIFLAPTGGIEDGLFEAEYLQGGTRYLGGEVVFDVAVLPTLTLFTGLDIVNAELTEAVTSPVTAVTTPNGTSLPRIPPLRGRVGFDLHYKGFGFRPEAVMASSQNDVFAGETRTPGYTVFNIGASYTVARAHAIHVISVNAFNLGNRLYRNHVSFIKDLAPEIGRGVRVSYTLRFQ